MNLKNYLFLFVFLSFPAIHCMEPDEYVPDSWEERELDIDLLNPNNSKINTDIAMTKGSEASEPDHQVELIQKMKKLNVDVNALDNNGHTLLGQAARLNRHQLIDELLKQGALINQQDKYGRTALSWSANSFIAKKLIDGGAHINICDASSMSPLCWAVRQNNTELVKVLLDEGAYVMPILSVEVPAFKEDNLLHMEYIQYNGTNALELAIANNNQEILQLFLDKRPMDSYSTWLHYAIKEKNKALIQRLLTKNLNIEYRLADGLTPIQRAEKQENNDILLLLLSQFATLTDSMGRTALHWAIIHQNIESIITLIKRGWDPQRKDLQGKTCIYLAEELKRYDIVMLLLSKNVQLVDSCRRTGLCLAAQMGNNDLIKTAIQEGANIEHEAMFSITPLLLSSQFGKKTATKLLIDFGADVNTFDKFKKTPLHWILINHEKYTGEETSGAFKKISHRSAVKLAKKLREHGADKTIIDDKRQTALSIYQNYIKPNLDNKQQQELEMALA